MYKWILAIILVILSLFVGSFLLSKYVFSEIENPLTNFILADSGNLRIPDFYEQKIFENQCRVFDIGDEIDFVEIFDNSDFVIYPKHHEKIYISENEKLKVYDFVSALTDSTKTIHKEVFKFFEKNNISSAEIEAIKKRSLYKFGSNDSSEFNITFNGKTSVNYLQISDIFVSEDLKSIYFIAKKKDNSMVFVENFIEKESFVEIYNLQFFNYGKNYLIYGAKELSYSMPGREDKIVISVNGTITHTSTNLDFIKGREFHKDEKDNISYIISDFGKQTLVHNGKEIVTDKNIEFVEKKGNYSNDLIIATSENLDKALYSISGKRLTKYIKDIISPIYLKESEATYYIGKIGENSKYSLMKGNEIVSKEYKNIMDFQYFPENKVKLFRAELDDGRFVIVSNGEELANSRHTCKSATGKCYYTKNGEDFVHINYYLNYVEFYFNGKRISRFPTLGTMFDEKVDYAKLFSPDGKKFVFYYTDANGLLIVFHGTEDFLYFPKGSIVREVIYSQNKNDQIVVIQNNNNGKITFFENGERKIEENIPLSIGNFSFDETGKNFFYVVEQEYYANKDVNGNIVSEFRSGYIAKNFVEKYFSNKKLTLGKFGENNDKMYIIEGTKLITCN